MIYRERPEANMRLIVVSVLIDIALSIAFFVFR